jgi:hypothetical protein
MLHCKTYLLIIKSEFLLVTWHYLITFKSFEPLVSICITHTVTHSRGHCYCTSLSMMLGIYRFPPL